MHIDSVPKIDFAATTSPPSFNSNSKASPKSFFFFFHFLPFWKHQFFVVAFVCWTHNFKKISGLGGQEKVADFGQKTSNIISYQIRWAEEEEPWLLGTVLARNIRWVWCVVCAFCCCWCFCSWKLHVMQMPMPNSTDSKATLQQWNPTMGRRWWWWWRRREIFPVWILGMRFLVVIRGKSVQALILYTTDKFPPSSTQKKNQASWIFFSPSTPISSSWINQSPP